MNTQAKNSNVLNWPNPRFCSVLPRNDDFHVEGYNFGIADQMFDRSIERNMILKNSHISWAFRSHISCIVRAISSTCSDDMKRGIHASAIKRGIDLVVPIATVLIGFYSSLNELESSRRLFHEVSTKDLILWSAMVSACSKNEQYLEAIVTFGKMQHSGFSPNAVSLLSVLPACANIGALQYGKQIHGFAIRRAFHTQTGIQNSILDMYGKCGKLDAATTIYHGIKEKNAISWKTMIFGCIENGKLREAIAMFYHMRASHVEPEKVTLGSVINICSEVKDLVSGLELHCYSIKVGVSDSSYIATTLLRMYSEFKKVEEAKALFNQMHDKDHVAWSAMISVYSQSGHPSLAFEMFKQMQSSKMEANEITFVSLLRACSSIEAQDLGRSIHARITRLAHSHNVFVASALIDFYCKIGKLRQGEALFDRLEKRDLVSWGSMINGYGINGYGEAAIATFDDMLKHGLMPNGVLFLSLLSTCSHCGLVNEGWQWFYSMEDKFGISPTLPHYTCMVNLLGRQGRLDEALGFVKSMPIKPDVTVWGALLGWCTATHGDVKVAQIAAEQLIRLDPNNTTSYLTLSNLYSKLGMWEDSVRIRETVEERGLMKTAGYSIL
ncbi:pentatricopeptide repeat-containing protein At1g11290, chloroplastic-like [Typha angustifolia]|uniref:pentatricopeptide repeat-containing protein At1g11290, chloroplastic-like n=1 Tax=Typha angustifolia TaxID=59011 RepID=UPI003C2E2FEF